MNTNARNQIPDIWKKLLMADLIYKDEAYEIAGFCMEVHNHLGPGLLEIIYKEAIENGSLMTALSSMKEKRSTLFITKEPCLEKDSM